MSSPAPSPRRDPIRIAALISGGGTTLANFTKQIAAGQLHAEIACAIASNDKAFAKLQQQAHAFPIHAIRRKDYPLNRPAEFSDVVFRTLRDARVELVCLAGFLSLLAIPEDFRGRILNIHPALLPSFGGQGMFGHHVHEAVLNYGCKVSGCTVHFADNQYDHGPVLIQRTCPVLEDDTPDSLAARVFEQECLAYPEAIELIAQGRVYVEGRHARISPASR